VTETDFGKGKEMMQNGTREDPEELLLHMVGTLSSEQSHQNKVRYLVEQIKSKLRHEIANDVNRAERPVFAANENPDLVVRTTRAIDIRLIEMGAYAPYYVAPDE
jgi:hypothetical protein